MSDDDGDNSDDYTPISCHRYSEFEVAILHHKTLRLHWRDDNAMDHIDRAVPKDLQTLNHAEYLIAEDSQGQQLRIRLDRILSCNKEPL
mgnify:CR=1 FL=1